VPSFPFVPPTVPDPPERRAFERTGRSAVERLAVLAVARDVAAMPASLVVQLALWPDDLAHWARAERVSESLVYNTLAARKPYARVRQLLARRLDVPLGVVNQLVDAGRPLPAVRREPGAPLVTPDPAVDWSAPPYPPQRDGGNPIERRAVRTAARDVAAMPASTVVGLALWPETLTAWSRAQRLKTSVVWATLAGSPSDPVRDLLARRLGVSMRELGELIDGRRRTPAAQQAWALNPAAHDALLAEALAAPAPVPAVPAPSAAAAAVDAAAPTAPAGPDPAVSAPPAPDAVAARRRRSSPRAAPPGDDQISLGL
jgi:DNA-binding transcriptional regulator YdaS (Cro superfamily)